MKKSTNGFTLVELLVAISILAILGTIGIIYYISVRKNSRDQQRLRDLNGIKQALELYRNDNRSYPANLDVLTTPTKYLKSVPNDPSGGGRSYKYVAGSDNTSFILCAQKEGSNSFDVPSGCGSPLTCNTGTDQSCNMGLSSD